MDWEEKKAKMDKIMNREDTDHNTDHDQSSHDEEIQNDKILKVNDMVHTKAEETSASFAMDTEIKLRYREDGCPIKPKHVRHPYAYLIRSLLVGIIMILSVISGSVITPMVKGEPNQQEENVEAATTMKGYHSDISDLEGRRIDLDISFNGVRANGDNNTISTASFSVTNLSSSITVKIVLKSLINVDGGTPMLAIFYGNKLYREIDVSNLTANSSSATWSVPSPYTSSPRSLSLYTYSYVKYERTFTVYNNSYFHDYWADMSTNINVSTDTFSHTINGPSENYDVPAGTKGDYYIVELVNIKPGWTVGSSTPNLSDFDKTTFDVTFQIIRKSAYVDYALYRRDTLIGEFTADGETYSSSYSTIATDDVSNYASGSVYYRLEVRKRILLNLSFMEDTASGTNWTATWKAYDMSDSNVVQSGTLSNNGDTADIDLPSCEYGEYDPGNPARVHITVSTTGSGYVKYNNKYYQKTLDYDTWVYSGYIGASIYTETIDATTYYQVYVKNNTGTSIVACGSNVSNGGSLTTYYKYNTSYSISASNAGFNFVGTGTFNVGTSNKSHTITATRKTYFFQVDATDPENGYDNSTFKVEIDTDLNGSYDYVKSGVRDWSSTNGGIYVPYGAPIRITVSLSTGFYCGDHQVRIDNGSWEYNGGGWSHSVSGNTATLTNTMPNINSSYVLLLEIFAEQIMSGGYDLYINGAKQANGDYSNLFSVTIYRNNSALYTGGDLDELTYCFGGGNFWYGDIVKVKITYIANQYYLQGFKWGSNWVYGQFSQADGQPSKVVNATFEYSIISEDILSMYLVSNSYTVTVTGGTNVVETSGSGTYTYGTKVTIVGKAAPGYWLYRGGVKVGSYTTSTKRWEESFQVTVTSNLTYNYTAVSSAVTVNWSATFEGYESQPATMVAYRFEMYNYDIDGTEHKYWTSNARTGSFVTYTSHGSNSHIIIIGTDDSYWYHPNQGYSTFAQTNSGLTLTRRSIQDLSTLL